MNCLKCGAETSFENVFCDSCLKEMEKYPVAPGTSVSIPVQTSRPVKKAVRKKTVSPEEQIAALKKKIRLLTVLLTAVSLLAVLLLYPAVKYLMEDHFLPGQNYTSIVSKSSSTEPAETN